MFLKLMFQQDIDPKHTSVLDWTGHSKISIAEWPVQYLDLDLIDFVVWHGKKLFLRKRMEKCRRNVECSLAPWAGIPATDTKHLQSILGADVFVCYASSTLVHHGKIYCCSVSENYWCSAFNPRPYFHKYLLFALLLSLSNISKGNKMSLSTAEKNLAFGHAVRAIICCKMYQ